MSEKTLFIRWHLGLGDAIICNGLIRELAKRHNLIHVPAKPDKFASVFWMFSDLPNVIVICVDDDADMNATAKTKLNQGLGLWSQRGILDWQHWDKQFYEDVGVPFDARWNSFYVPPCKTLPYPSGEYAFVHEEPGRGMAIQQFPKMAIYAPPHPPHIFWNLAALQHATEIHVVNSCFLNLAESVPTAARRLVVHNYARKDRAGLPTLRKNWEVL